MLERFISGGWVSGGEWCNVCAMSLMPELIVLYSTPQAVNMMARRAVRGN